MAYRVTNDGWFEKISDHQDIIMSGVHEYTIVRGTTQEDIRKFQKKKLSGYIRYQKRVRAASVIQRVVRITMANRQGKLNEMKV